MMNMHSKYDNMCKNGIFYALNYINNHVIASISFMLSDPPFDDFFLIRSNPIYRILGPLLRDRFK